MDEASVNSAVPRHARDLTANPHRALASRGPFHPLLPCRRQRNPARCLKIILSEKRARRYRDTSSCKGEEATPRCTCQNQARRYLRSSASSCPGLGSHTIASRLPRDCHTTATRLPLVISICFCTAHQQKHTCDMYIHVSSPCSRMCAITR